jgi:uncharacterized protein (DUF362 family)
VSKEHLSRAEFLGLIGGATIGVTFLPGAQELLGEVAPDLDVDDADGATLPYISVARGRSLNGSHVAKITRTAIANLGGMGRFVHKGDWVVVKPNIYGPRTPAQACTTNPTVVATVVREALKAGARKVTVMDNPCGGGALESYKKSGISSAVKKAGGKIVVMSGSRFKTYRIPKGSSIKTWPVYRDIMECDVLIDVPIAKNHGGAVVTGACKGLMGCCANMGGLHNKNRGLSVNIPDLVRLMRPDLTVVDGTRARVRNGPGGTDLGSVRKRYTVLASRDPVAADAYTAKYLLGISPGAVPHLKNAAKLKLGRTDLARLRIKKVRV